MAGVRGGSSQLQKSSVAHITIIMRLLSWRKGVRGSGWGVETCPSLGFPKKDWIIQRMKGQKENARHII